MDTQKNALPPRIPGSQMPNNAQGNSYATFAMVGTMLIGLFILFNFVSSLYSILPFMADLGFGFMLKYLFGSNAFILLILVAGVGAFALSQRNKWGWPLAYGAALFNIFIVIFSVIMTLGTPFAWSVYGSFFQTILFYLGFIVSIGTIVILSMQPVRTLFQVDSNQRMIGLGIMGFLVLDILLCHFLF